MQGYSELAINVHPPNTELFGIDNWVEQILGEVVKPLFEIFENEVDWWWVTRYGGKYPGDFEQGYEIPDDYLVEIEKHGKLYRYVIFRVSVRDESVSEFKRQCGELVSKAGCFIDPQGWAKFDYVADLGWKRWIHSSRSEEEIKRRAYLVAKFVSYTVLLELSALEVNENGKWNYEENEDKNNNPQGTFFQSARHLFSNSTGLPFEFFVFVQGDKLMFYAPYNGDPRELPVTLGELAENEGKWVRMWLKL